MPPLTRMLASFVADTPSADIPAAVLEPAKSLILDTVGVALAASARAIGAIVARHVAENAGGPAIATVFGGAVKAPPPLAAFANGTLANALDFDEGSHLSTHILPVALALAEQRDLSGRQVLDAFILAYEAGARLTQAIDFKRRQKRGPTQRGWWHVGLVGPIAASLAASRLLAADAERTATAIGIASTSSGGFRRNLGTMAKALHSGNAARAGIEAAMLAARGFSADTEILEAPLGFLQAVVEPEDCDPTAITERLGRRPYVLEGTLRTKRYPACNPGHPLIDAALRLAGERGIGVASIASIEADLHTFSLLRADAHDEESAGFCGAYLIAATLVRGSFALDALDEDTIHDERIQALMKRIHHVPAGEPETMTVFLRDGRQETIEVRPASRLSPGAATFEKFRRCATPVIGRDAAENLEQQILNLDAQASIGELMAAAVATQGSTPAVGSLSPSGRGVG